MCEDSLRNILCAPHCNKAMILLFNSSISLVIGLSVGDHVSTHDIQTDITI